MDNHLNNEKSKLSIVIPCFNEGMTLEKCVESVQTVANESLCLEVIIVDDGSTDGSLSIAGELEKNTGK